LFICRFGSPSENQKSKKKAKRRPKNEKKKKSKKSKKKAPKNEKKKKRKKGPKKRKQNVLVRAEANAAAVRGVRAREREVRDRGARRSRVGL
jgi:septal ring factor EnvC (AmiA/AmiB activator)